MDFLYDLKDNFGKVLIVVGVLLIIVGVSLFSTIGSVYSAGSLFFGITFFIFGLFLQLGVFSESFRSIGGLGNLFVCISVVLFVFAAAMIQFQDISVVGYVQEVFKGGRLPFYRLIITTDRPYLWLSDILVHVGICFLVVGLSFKVYSFFRA